MGAPAPEPDHNDAKEIALQLHQDVRRLQERGQLILGAGIAASGLSIPLVTRAPDIGLSLTLSLLTLAIAWHSNLDAEVAAVAEWRDLVADEYDHGKSRPLLYFASLGKVGRENSSGYTGGIIPILIFVGTDAIWGAQVFGWISLAAVESTLPRAAATALWAVVSATCISVVVIAFFGVTFRRSAMRDELYPAGRRARPTSKIEQARRFALDHDRGWDREVRVAERFASGAGDSSPLSDCGPATAMGGEP